MNTHYCFYHSNRVSKPGMFLVLFNLVGLLLGISLAKPVDVLRYVFLSAYITKPSILFLFLTIVVSIGFSVFILKTRFLILSFPFVFFKSVCHGFCGMLAFYVIGEGAWLIRFLFLFSSYGLSVLLWWLFIRHFKCLRQSFTKDVILVAYLSMVIFVLDIFLVPGLLSCLSTYF